MTHDLAAATEDELVRSALDGLFAIACEDRPLPVRESVREQVDELAPAERRRLVEQLVDTDRLEALVRDRGSRELARPPSAPEAPLAKVDEALEPLVAWTCGEEAARRLAAMDERDRFHVLFSSLGSGGGPP